MLNTTTALAAAKIALNRTPLGDYALYATRLQAVRNLQGAR